ncbi:MAG TPA: sulfatase-like hydrolase/transferase [Acidobacteriaceae bacterium]|nr:sulfatase-like hydrolase/transferase [Acidobacteriaceae bacterium]
MSPVPFTLAEFDLRERAVSRKGRWIKSAQLALALVVLPQVSTLLWWMQTHSWIQLRGFVNIEYLLLFAVALLYPGWVTISALTAELTIALLEPLGHLYYFSPGDAIRSFRYLSLVPTRLLLVYLLVLLVYMGGCVVILRFALAGLPRGGSRQVAGMLVAVVLCSLSYDLSAGHLRPMYTSPEHRDEDLRTTKVVRAPVASLAYATFILNRGTRVPARQLMLSSALGHAIGGLQRGTKPNIVLVLTESWGLAVDPRVNQAELAPYLQPDLLQSYRVETGTVEFFGSTTSGETRELCGNTLGRWGDTHSVDQYRSCWPAELGRDGYTTIAVHGFTPTMYDRDTWYPELAFSEQVFLPELQRDGAKICSGAFPGACDADVAKWIGNRLEAKTPDRPLFVHWVTLNSHLPVAAVQDPGADRRCQQTGIEEEGSLCAWFNRVLDVHKGVAELAMKSGIGPTIFIIVGDHAPPFLRPEVRDRFSQVVVPWIVLRPRPISAPTSMYAASRPKSADPVHEHRAAVSRKHVRVRRVPRVTPKMTG